MLEEFTHRGSRDFNQRYASTYGWYNHEGKRILVYVQNVGETEVIFQDTKGVIYTALADKGITFEFLPVERGLYNVENDVVSLQRRPARQWQRGISAANTYLFSFTKGEHINPGFKILENVFGPQDNGAYIRQWLLGKRTKVALSQQFAIIDDGVYIYEKRIGSFLKNRFVMDDKIFFQEIQDLVMKHMLPYNVEIS